MVAHALEQGKALEEFTLAEFQAFSPLFQEDIYEAISLLTCVNGRKVPGGPATDRVLEHVRELKNWLKEARDGRNRR